MSKTDYDPKLTGSGFPEGSQYRRGKKSHKLYSVENKLLGSISDDGVYDLDGKMIGALKSEEQKESGDGKKIRVAEYASETRGFRLVGNELYSLDGNVVGYYKQRERNVPRISVLSVLAAALAVIIALIAIIGVAPKPAPIIPVIDIRDVNGTWEAQGTVAVFPSKIRPGDEGEYGFVLNNPHPETIKYGFELTPVYEGIDIDYFPITFRLKMNNVLVETSEWKRVDELTISDLTILGDSTQSFTLQWRWAFSDGNDDKDTAIGVDGGKISLLLHVYAQEVDHE